MEGFELAIFNGGDGVFHATSAACPHEGGPLGEGRLSRDAIVCPWHGFDFDRRSGACRADPALAVTTYPVRVAGDALLVEIP